MTEKFECDTEPPSSCDRQILLVEDDEDMRSLIRVILTKRGYQVTEACDGIDALEKMTDKISVVLLDILMPRLNGMECLALLKKNYPNCEVIMLSVGGACTAIDVMERGAFWYIQKPVETEDLLGLIKRACEFVKLREKQEELKLAILEPAIPIVSTDTFFISSVLKEQIAQATSIESPVLITGEAGTGKSSLARLIHHNSPRADSPFVLINCLSVPRELLEAELFGFEAAAYPGALKARPGRLEIADGGTVFLDDVDKLPLELQPKLLKFLENKTIERIGSNQPKKIDIRLICATRQDIEGLCSDGKFLEDLYKILKVTCINLAPLHESKEEFQEIVNIITKKISARYKTNPPTIEKDAMAVLTAYHWPGNIGELENCLERAILVSGLGKPIKKRAIVLCNRTVSRNLGDASLITGKSLEEIELDVINKTLSMFGGNKRETARYLKISEKTLYNKLHRE